MADPVTGLPSSGKVKAVSKTARPDNTASQTTPGELKATDNIQLTKTLTSIERLSAALAQGDVVDRAKVEKIRAAIANGEYSVDSDRVAKKFLELEKLLEK
ncbi:MAG: flagellar biosynthesis anti-sigma factor FlgM [Gammaproteobacteria bacterium]|nr:flagellar biosynthesis anti-sigma factor FlgM [Gammaproteobacteria bacterium]